MHPNKYKAGMSSISHKNKFEIIAKTEQHDTNLQMIIKIAKPQ